MKASKNRVSHKSLSARRFVDQNRIETMGNYDAHLAARACRSPKNRCEQTFMFTIYRRISLELWMPAEILRWNAAQCTKPSCKEALKAKECKKGRAGTTPNRPNDATFAVSCIQRAISSEISQYSGILSAHKRKKESPMLCIKPWVIRWRIRSILIQGARHLSGCRNGCVADEIPFASSYDAPLCLES